MHNTEHMTMAMKKMSNNSNRNDVDEKPQKKNKVETVQFRTYHKFNFSFPGRKNYFKVPEGKQNLPEIL